MKKIRKIVCLVGFMVLINSVSFAQGPPNPPVDPSIGGEVVGGGAPIDGGSNLLLIMGALWAYRKYHKTRKLNSDLTD